MKSSLRNTVTTVFLGLVLTCHVALAGVTAGQLIGRWSQGSGSAPEWTFREDGSGFMRSADSQTHARFNWRLKGEVLVVETAGLRVDYTTQWTTGAYPQLKLVDDASGRSYVLRQDR